MNTLTLLVGVLCMVAVYARHTEGVNEPDLLSPDENDGVRTHGSDHNRHRRRRWQMNYGYEYPQPPHPYYPERRDYNRNEQDHLPQIIRLLEEILVYVKRPQSPPPPPQPIYIPYPVAYPVPQFISCPDKEIKKVNISERFPVLDDPNQNWGFATSKEDSGSEDLDGARPISFDPIKPNRPLKRPAPKVDHGSVQGDITLSTPAPNLLGDQAILRMPNMCNAAVLSCCGSEKQQQKACFNGFGCGLSYDNGNACSPDSISSVLDSFQTAYSPIPPV